MSVAGAADGGFEFDEDTAVGADGHGRWRATIGDGWGIAGSPNGGYLASVGLAALRKVLPHPDPMSVTTYFLSRTDPGDVEVATEVLRTGNSLSTGTARVHQAGQLRYVVTATLGDLDAAEGASRVTGTPPELPPLDACVRAEGGPGRPPILDRFDLRLTPESAGWALGSPSGVAVAEGWIRFADGREPDTWSLPLFADSFPPAIANVAEAMWVPTLEFTVHVRARPAPGWLRCSFRTRFLMDGYLEEDGELWDSEDRPVALSRQLARVHR